MSDELLPYYNDELNYIRKVGAEFAKRHPKIAGKLRLGASSVDDPFVSRLIESFAFLTGRIRHKLDDNYADISDALLNILYPHYQRPIPSMSIMQFAASNNLDSSHFIDKKTIVSCEAEGVGACKFSTAYPVTIWPLEISAAKLVAQPFSYSLVENTNAYSSCLRLKLKTNKSDLRIADLGLSTLRFYINTDPQQAYDIYELLFNNLKAIAVASPAGNLPAKKIPLESLKPVGFSENEGLLPYPPNAFIGYRLLSEYFAFPQKFLFFDLTGLESLSDYPFEQEIELHLYFDKGNQLLEKNINGSSLALGCTPIVNIFQQKAEPISVDQTQFEYHIIPDANRLLDCTEVYSVDHVAAYNDDGQSKTYYPFYGLNHNLNNSMDSSYWFATRKPTWQLGNNDNQGSEVFISFTDANESVQTINVDITCTNRDIPSHLPYGGDLPRFTFWDGEHTAVAKMKTLQHFTPTYRPPVKSESQWQLISQLSLNYLSLTDNVNAIDALKEMLHLYNLNHEEYSEAIIDSISAINVKRTTARHPDDVRYGFCQGSEIELLIDEKKLAGSGVFLFASILENFFSLYCSINSFTKLVLKTQQRGVLRQWKPRLGNKMLL